MTRLVVVAFFGPARTDAARHPHESPWKMTVPLVLLSILSVIGGFIGLKTFYNGWSTSVLQTLGETNPPPRMEPTVFLEMVLPSTLVLLGIVSALALYWKAERDPLDLRLLAHKFYFDEFYDGVLVGGQQVVARFLAWIDSWILDGVIIRGAAYLSGGVGEVLRLLQTGSLQSYAFIFTLGGIILIYLTIYAH
jgi:NADH-quinone oxidoreductase subunit L